MNEKRRALDSTIRWSPGSHLLASRRRPLIGHHYRGFAVHHGLAVLVGADCREPHPALRDVDVEDLQLHGHGVTEPDGTGEPERLAEVDRPRAGEALRNRSRNESGSEHPMRDPSTEL